MWIAPAAGKGREGGVAGQRGVCSAEGLPGDACIPLWFPGIPARSSVAHREVLRHGHPPLGQTHLG